MDAILKAKTHFESRELKHKHIEAWDLDVYAYPITMAERSKIHKKSEGNAVLFLIYAVIEKALDADGKKLFDLKDKIALLNDVDGDIVSELGGWLIDSEDPESIEKK